MSFWPAKKDFLQVRFLLILKLMGSLSSNKDSALKNVNRFFFSSAVKYKFFIFISFSFPYRFSSFHMTLVARLIFCLLFFAHSRYSLVLSFSAFFWWSRSNLFFVIFVFFIQHFLHKKIYSRLYLLCFLWPHNFIIQKSRAVKIWFAALGMALCFLGKIYFFV